MHRTWLCGRPSSVPQCATMYLEGCSAGSNASTLSVVAKKNRPAARKADCPIRAFQVLKAGQIEIFPKKLKNRGSLIDRIVRISLFCIGRLRPKLKHELGLNFWETKNK